MAAITFSLTNILSLTSFVSPLIVSFFMILYSIINDNIVKGLIYLIGLIILTFFTRVLKNSLQNKQDKEIASPFCNILPDPFTLSKDNDIYNSPSLSTTILAYSASYILFPMILNGHINASLITFFVFILGVNGGVEIQNVCTPPSGILFGLIIGSLFGIFYYTLLSASGNKSLGYFTEVPSNNIQCAKPGKQQFRCNMYKNGKLIGEVPSEENKFSLDTYPPMPEDERNELPKCKYQNSGPKGKGIYVFCGDRSIGRWGNRSDPLERVQDEKNCNHANRTKQKVGTCGQIYDHYHDFREGKEDFDIVYDEYWQKKVENKKNRK